MVADLRDRFERDERDNAVYVPPHSVEAEQAVLGALMLDNRAWGAIADRLVADDFYRRDHQLIFAAIAELAGRDEPSDEVTLNAWLERKGISEETGGLVYLAGLRRDTPSAANVRAYADAVRERSTLRRLQAAGANIVASVATDSRPAPELLADATAALSAIQAGSDLPARRSFELVPAHDLLTAQAPPEWDVDGLFECGVVAGLVAPPESGKSLFALNLLACIATGHDFHGRKVKRGLAVYLCGEGFPGIRKRLQALDLRYGLGIADAPLVVSRTSASLLEPTEVLRVRAAIDAAEQRYGMPLAIVAQDTLSRFIAPGKESDAPDMGAYFQVVDELRRGATSITLHHPGHGDATRARGSSSWRAALDCEYTLAMAGDVLTVSCAKMKDGDKPAPFSFRLETAPTSTAREDGSPVMSVVLVPADGVVSAPIKPTGKNQKQLLAELERREPAIWTEKELREIARGLGMHRNSAMAAVLGLRQLGYLTDTIGGARLTHDMHESTNHAQDR